jgi:hypothetical protein
MATGRFLEDLAEHIVVANNDTRPSLPTSYIFAIPDAATADYDIVVDAKFEVFDVIVGKIGAGAGNTVQIKNGATAVSDAIAAAVDKTITRAGTIDRTTNNNVIAAGGTLRCTATKSAGSMQAVVEVRGFVRV